MYLYKSASSANRQDKDHQVLYYHHFVNPIRQQELDFDNQYIRLNHNLLKLTFIPQDLEFLPRTFVFFYFSSCFPWGFQDYYPSCSFCSWSQSKAFPGRTLLCLVMAMRPSSFLRISHSLILLSFLPILSSKLSAGIMISFFSMV